MKRSDIYKALRDQLKASIAGVSVDLQRGQMERPGSSYPLPFPLALLSFSRIKWEVMSPGFEKGKMSVVVDYYKHLPAGTFDNAESEDETIALIDSPDEIYRALGYFSKNSLFAELYRTEEQELRTSGRLIGYRVIFETNVFQEDEE